MVPDFRNGFAPGASSVIGLEELKRDSSHSEKQMKGACWSRKRWQASSGPPAGRLEVDSILHFKHAAMSVRDFPAVECIEVTVTPEQESRKREGTPDRQPKL
jgi:hypothetical protein